IIEPDKTSFELQFDKIFPYSNSWPPEPLFGKPIKSNEEEEEENAYRFADLVEEEVDGAVCDDGEVCCPRCNLRISVRAKNSWIKYWESS
ncbi:hypothetical protein, partial [Salmonella sp. s57402]|uniref:hypothetical protein n=1 Tax=Salmonella sp. s57402 TaxID=3159695 RepID=UPI00397FA7AD